MQVDSDYINFIVKSVERSYFKFTLFVKSPRKRNEYAFCPFCLNLYIPSKCHKKGGHLQYYHQSKNLPIPDVVLRKWRRMLEKYPESIYSYALEKAIEIETQERLNKFEAERRQVTEVFRFSKFFKNIQPINRIEKLHVTLSLLKLKNEFPDLKFRSMHRGINYIKSIEEEKTERNEITVFKIINDNMIVVEGQEEDDIELPEENLEEYNNYFENDEFFGTEIENTKNTNTEEKSDDESNDSKERRDVFFNLLDEDTVISHATDIAMRIREKKYKY